MARKKSVLEEGKELVEKAIENAEEKLENVVEIIEKDVEKVKGEKSKIKKEGKKEGSTSKLEELKKKAKALEKKLKEVSKEDIKEKVRGEKKEKDTLVPIEDYLKSSIHLGTRVITPDMRSYVYKRRADGLAVFNTDLLDEKIREGGEYLSKFAPQDFILICKRESGWKAAELFGKTLGVRTFTKKYPAGSLTNTTLGNFIEANLILICDPWLDKNALADALKIKMNVMSICDTNNFTRGVDFIVPGNNKSAKSIGMILYLLAKLYAGKRKLDVEIPSIENWIDDWAQAQIPA